MAELNALLTEAARFTAPADLKATVLSANPHSNQVALHDASGVAVVELDLQRWPLQPGDVVALKGPVVAERGRLRGGAGPVVENDGYHAALEVAGGTYLTAGRHLFRVGYFNAAAGGQLSLEFQGPNAMRQALPAKMLFHTEASKDGMPQFAPGLTFASYIGRWPTVPNFRELSPARRGIVPNLTTEIRERDEFFALNFAGWIEIPTTGRYDFFLTSDDGSRLWIGEGDIEAQVIGKEALPAAQKVARMPSSGFLWGTIEGIVTFQHLDRAGRLELQLNTGSDSIRVEVADIGGYVPQLFSRVQVTGVVGPERVFSSVGSDIVLVKSAPPAAIPPILTVAELPKRFTGKFPVTIPATLEGKVLASSRNGGAAIFQDATGQVLIELPPTVGVTEGSQIRVTGPLRFEGNRLRARSGRLVDNDGVHAEQQKSSSVHLRVGKHPFQVMYFNAFGGGSLDLAWAGPGFSSQSIPSSALFRLAIDPVTGDPDWLPGLDFASYEGYWRALPNPLDCILKQSGVADGIASSIVTNEVTYALDFRGFIEIPTDGEYVFSLRSDDGSALYVGEEMVRVEILGSSAVPAPTKINVRQSMSKDRRAVWSEVEGVVSFVQNLFGAARLEIASSSGHMHVDVASAPDLVPELLLNSRIRVSGLCLPSFTSDGQYLAAVMQTPSLGQLEILNLPNRLWSDHRVRPISSLTTGDSLVHLSARVHSTNGVMIADDDSGRIVVEADNLQIEAPGSWMELLGHVAKRGTNFVLASAVGRPLAGSEDFETMRLLTTIDEVKSLKRKEAERGYAAKLRGTITALMPVGFFLQDSTRGIYVDWTPPAGADQLQVGDYWEVEGTTTIDFAPNVIASKARRIGPGVLPEPLRPSWDQLNNGSLDTHYIEIEGIVTYVADSNIKLLTRAGKLGVFADDIDPQILKNAVNARVKMRGCIAPDRDEKQNVRPGQITLYTTSISVVEPASSDVFEAPLKQISDLSLFDTEASALQRVKIVGQILHARENEYFLFDGTNGMRFVSLNGKLDIHRRDRVEVVGFPHLSGVYPVLRDAIARKIGSSPLPEPRELPAANLLSAELDSTLVQVEGSLVSSRFQHGERLLEVQVGPRTFQARLRVIGKDALSYVAVGSRLQLVGVYEGQGGDRVSGREIDSFDLLLNSARDVVVLERPVWWTLQHTMSLFGALAAVLLAAAAWIKALRNRVDQRTRELQEEIQVRQVAEERAQRARKEAEAANSAKSQFLASMSHEIRTPMNGVLGMTDLLLDSELNPQQREFAETSRKSAESLLTIINDILDFSKIEAGKLDFEAEDFDLVETVDSVIQILAPNARAKTLSLDFVVREEVPRYLRGDSGRLRQVLLNLLGNGIKFTSSGEVVLDIKLVAQKDGRATLAFAVKDTGIGISEDARRRLFQPFTQADSSTTRRFGGTGLGLAISKRLVEMMDGKIAVESQPGKGSTFWFTATFELAKRAASVPEVPKTDSAASGRGLKILMAEDNLINQKVAMHQLKQIGYEADAVVNGVEVLEAIRRQSYDVILMDCQMPELDGLEATRKLRAEGSAVWIIAMTANAMQGDRESCLEAGMDDYLTKPIRANGLLEALQRVGSHSPPTLLAK